MDKSCLFIKVCNCYQLVLKNMLEYIFLYISRCNKSTLE